MPSQPRTPPYKTRILSCLVAVALYSATVVGHLLLLPPVPTKAPMRATCWTN